ncbi:hypothetical protein SELMODRAFT_420487 [Selaginella moellendorffii]|uniref:Uncharacterized protein n=1 Tax=Selaginella moellendorffii TaxID=88036 RepID=D8SC53_SELML|nr:hypothetical protein SELMODRAFT_420487 [Selaginella moellendorffii]
MRRTRRHDQQGEAAVHQLNPEPAVRAAAYPILPGAAIARSITLPSVARSNVAATSAFVPGYLSPGTIVSCEGNGNPVISHEIKQQAVLYLKNRTWMVAPGVPNTEPRVLFDRSSTQTPALRCYGEPCSGSMTLVQKSAFGKARKTRPPPSPHANHAAAVYASYYLYIFGGGSHSSCFSDLHVLNLKKAILADLWYIVGGRYNKSGISKTIVLNMKMLDWSLLTSVPQTYIICELSDACTEDEHKPIKGVSSSEFWWKPFYKENGSYNTPKLLELKRELEVALVSCQDENNMNGDIEGGCTGIGIIAPYNAQAIMERNPIAIRMDARGKEDKLVPGVFFPLSSTYVVSARHMIKDEKGNVMTRWRAALVTTFRPEMLSKAAMPRALLEFKELLVVADVKTVDPVLDVIHAGNGEAYLENADAGFWDITKDDEFGDCRRPATSRRFATFWLPCSLGCKECCLRHGQLPLKVLESGEEQEKWALLKTYSFLVEDEYRSIESALKESFCGFVDGDSILSVGRVVDYNSTMVATSLSSPSGSSGAPIFLLKPGHGAPLKPANYDLATSTDNPTFVFQYLSVVLGTLPLPSHSYWNGRCVFLSVGWHDTLEF